MSLSNKNIIVTGATSGLGSHIAQVLSSEGANVFIGGRRADRGAEVAKDTNTTFHVVDVADEESNKAFFQAAKDHFGGEEATVDAILLNAGVEGNNAETHASNLKINAYDYIYSVNVRGVILGIQYGLPLLKKGGSFVMTSSAGSIVPLGANPIYASSKAAVDSLVRSYANQFAESDDERLKSIRIVGVNPTLYATEMADRFVGGGETAQQAMEGFSKMVNPSQRVGQAKELATILRDFVHGDLPYQSGDMFVADADTHFPLSEYFDRMAKATQHVQEVQAVQ